MKAEWLVLAALAGMGMGRPQVAVRSSTAVEQVAATDGQVAKPGRTLTDAQWREDLAAMQVGMRETHKDLYHTVTREQLQAAFDRLSADVPRLYDDEIEVRMKQIAAMVRDGHSGLSTYDDKQVPLRFVLYPEGLFVLAADPAHAQAAGARVLSIGGVGWEEAVRRVNTIVSCDPENDGQQRSWAAAVLYADPKMLHGLGMAASGDAASYVFEKDGKHIAMTLAAERPNYDIAMFGGPAGWVSARGADGVLANAWTEPLQLTYVREAKAIYLQFNEVAPPADGSMEEFAKKLAEFERSNPDARRMVVDVRKNGGGDNTILRALLVELIRSRLNQRGQMYVLIGPTTFSAAENFVNRMQMYTDAIFVGEPTSNNVNFFGDPKGTELPNSHLDVEMAHLWWQDSDPRDMRRALMPEIAIEGSFADFVAGKDAALEYALYAPTPMRYEDAMSAAAARGYEPTTEAYHAYVNDPAHRYASDLDKKTNALGYALLSKHENVAAVNVFRLNAAVHLESSNAFDSLGDGYEAIGDKAKAIAAYQRSVALNPGNEHAKGEIKKLQAK